MRALLSKAPGGPETLELSEAADPVAAAGEVVVAIKACAINYPDVLVIEDKYQFKPERPFAPGGEIAGVIESVGEGVTGWSPGDRVIAIIGNGGLAERIAVDAARLHALPAERSFAEGAALLLTYVFGIVNNLVAFLGWFYCLALGRMSEGMRDLSAWLLRYELQTLAYLLIVTGRYPSLSGGPSA